MRASLLVLLLGTACHHSARGTEAPVIEGITFSCAAVGLGPYEVRGANVNNPRFGAVTTTIIIDGVRHHFGVHGWSPRRRR